LTNIGPLCEALGTNENITFEFTHGPFLRTPPAGFETYFGPAPHYRFFPEGPNRDITADREECLDKINSSEDPAERLEAFHLLLQDATPENYRIAMDWLLRIIDEDDEIDGIIGYSEGGSAASCVVVEDQKPPRKPRIKCAMFICGGPPLCPSADDKRLVIVENPEDRPCIPIPTLHIIAADDHFIAGSMALYERCNPDEAILFDHCGGHLVPRDDDALQEVKRLVEEMIDSC
jgi:hypothetical protein